MSTTEIPPLAPVAEDRTVAILSYITIIGFIVAIVMHGSKKTQLGAFHLRQVLGLIVTGIGFGYALSFWRSFRSLAGWRFSSAGWVCSPA